MLDDLIPTRRHDDRSPTRWEAECQIEEKRWTGTVHDLTDGGTFFQPQRCLDDGEQIYPEDAWMVARIADRVELRLMQGPHTDARFSGSVRWSGCSDVHRCGGLGIMFE